MIRKCLWLALFVVSSLTAQAQQLTQTIRGTVVDAESKFPLPGVNVALLNDDNSIDRGASTNIDGEFRIDNVPSGPQKLRVTYIGFKETKVWKLMPAAAVR